MSDNEQFIDAESSYSKENNTFQEILNRQIRRTSDVLSKELCLGIFLNRETGKTTQEDMRETAINHIRTTKTLMNPFIKDKFGKDIETIEKELKDFREEFGKKPYIIYGKGTFKNSEILHKKDSIAHSRLMDYTVERYREIFEVLILAYHKNKEEIRSFSQE